MEPCRDVDDEITVRRQASECLERIEGLAPGISPGTGVTFVKVPRDTRYKRLLSTKRANLNYDYCYKAPECSPHTLKVRPKP
jgi:hypothetical protein